MDIKRAINHTIDALSFDERPLALSFQEERQTHKDQSQVCIRAPTLVLSGAIEEAHSLAVAAGFTARLIQLYCDTLFIDEDQSITPKTPNDRTSPVLILKLYARKVEPSAPSARLTFEASHGSEIFFYTPKFPASLSVKLKESLEMQQDVVPFVSEGGFGVSFELRDGTITSTQLKAPDSRLEVYDYLNRIGNDGKIKYSAFLNDNIARLLQFQLLVAQANMHVNRAISIDLLAYVMAATDPSSNPVLHYQASSLWSSLTIQSQITAVPSVNVFCSKQILKARLTAAVAYETAFRRFALESTSTKIQGSSVLSLISKGDDAIDKYHFLLEIKQRNYNNAVTANNKALATFEKNSRDVTKFLREFEQGIEGYKMGKKEEAVKGIIKGVVGVAVAVGTIVATAGLAAPAALPAAGAAISTASKTVKLIAKLKEVFDKLKAIYEKLKPVVEKITEVLKIVTEVVEAVKAISSTTRSAVTLKPDIQSTDVYSVTAEWRNFDVTVREMEQSLGEYAIKGKEAYFHALKTLVNNGEAVILCQANLIQMGDELATTILENRMEVRNKDRLEKMSQDIIEDKATIDILMRAMFDRLLTIRTLIFQDFITYVSAFDFHSLKKNDIVTLSPVKPAVDYLDDAAKLQAAVVAFGSTTCIQSRNFSFQTLCGYDSPAHLAEILAQHSQVSFAISPQDSLWKGFDRIRMSSTRCFLDGVKWSPTCQSSRSLQLTLRSDERFFDIQTVPRQELVCNNVISGDQSKDDLLSIARAFVGLPRELLFEYVPESMSIVCDGQWGQLNDYTKQTPMTNWELIIDDGDAQDLDFSEFTGITMEFSCDVIWKGARRLAA